MPCRFLPFLLLLPLLILPGCGSKEIFPGRSREEVWAAAVRVVQRPGRFGVIDLPVSGDAELEPGKGTIVDWQRRCLWEGMRLKIEVTREKKGTALAVAYGPWPNMGGADCLICFHVRQELHAERLLIREIGRELDAPPRPP